jgi:hypothetical protein
MPKLCTDLHRCATCQQLTNCNTYTWACPWRNGDEDDSCEACLIEWARSMDEFEEHLGG